MIGSLLHICDCHLDHRLEADISYRVAKMFAADMRPNTIVVNGDFMDFEYLSTFTKNAPLLNENGRYKRDCEYANQELGAWRNTCDDMFFNEGNHENRVSRFLEATPSMAGAISIDKDFGMPELDIKYLEMNKVLKVGKLNFTHGWYCNLYHSRKHLDEMGDHIIYGHTHDHQVYLKPVRASREPYIAMSGGCLCSKNPHYLRNKPNRWMTGIIWIEIADNGFFTPMFLPIVRGQLTFNRHTWKIG